MTGSVECKSPDVASRPGARLVKESLAPIAITAIRKNQSENEQKYDH